jgi:hypothetical protein
MTMKRLLHIFVAAGLLGAAGACSVVTSSIPSMTNDTGEAWYTESKGFIGITWGSKVWYCPPPTQGPATCKQAKMVELTKDEVEATKQAEKASGQ